MCVMVHYNFKVVSSLEASFLYVGQKEGVGSRNVIRFVFRAFSRRSCPKPLTRSTFVRGKRSNNIYRCWYSRDDHRGHDRKCQALPIARVTQSLYTTKNASIR